MTTRRSVGGYEWTNELTKLEGLGEKIAKELEEMSQQAPTTEQSRRFTKLVSLSSQVAITALRLQGYKVKNEPATTTAWWDTGNSTA